jgi:hypothetical protein
MLRLLLQVCRHLRRLARGRVITRVQVRQPHLQPRHCPALTDLGFANLSAATALDLSHCLDWIRHPALTALVDLKAITCLTRLRRLDLRPSTDEIDSFEGDRVKFANGVLCWADGVFLRLWDRWMYAVSPGIPWLVNMHALSNLGALETLHFPITVRENATRHERLHSIAGLAHLRELHLGCEGIDNEALAALACAQSLTQLSLGLCRELTEAGMAAIGTMARLEVLLLHGCVGMPALGWQHLCTLSALRVLALYGRREGENVHFYRLSDPVAQAVPLSPEGVLRWLSVVLIASIACSRALSEC